MKILYILAFAGIALVAITLFVLLIIGFVQGIKEGPHPPEYYNGSLLPEPPEHRIQHVDTFGTWDGYSVVSENAEIKHYDWMGAYQGSSKQM